MKSIQEVINHIKAKRPVIWVETYEEDRFIQDFMDIIANASDPETMRDNPQNAFLSRYSLLDWSGVRGLREYDMAERCFKEPIERTADATQIMSRIDSEQRENSPETPIYLFKDLHKFLPNGLLYRAIRDVKEGDPQKYVPMIIVSPVVEIPLELDKLVTVVNYDLPTYEEILQLVNDAIDEIVYLNENTKGRREPYPVPDEDMTKTIARSCAGLTQSEITTVFRHSLVNYNELSPVAILDEKIQLIKKSGVLDFKLPQAKFENIGGNYAFKEWVDEVEKTFFQDAKNFGLCGPRGYLSLGIPGTAKTFTAEALANRLNLPFIKFDVSRIFDRLVGSSERNADRAFKVAKACAPCILLVDEIEKVLGGAESSNQSDSGTTNRVLSKFLELMHEENDVFVVMTSNDISQLPPALFRPGRVDAIWYFSYPTEEERKEIFRIHLEKTGKALSKKAIEVGAKEAINYTGAEIEEVCKVALRKCYLRYLEDKKTPCITDKDVLTAIKEVIPGYRSSKEKMQWLENWARNGKESRVRMSSGTNISSKAEQNDERLTNSYLKIEI